MFPCLEELTIIYCDKLRDLPDSLHTYISLQKLVVESCLDLSSLPGVLSPIQHLEIKNCSTVRLKLSRQEGHLKTLIIGGFIEELDAFPSLRYPFI